MLFADFRVRFDLTQIQRLVAAGFLPADADRPDDLRDAIDRLLAALPMPSPATPNHGLRAAG